MHLLLMLTNDLGKEKAALILVLALWLPDYPVGGPQNLAGLLQLA